MIKRRDSLLVFIRLYRIFRTIRRTYNPLFFSKMERGPYSPMRLIYGSGCALSPTSKQILCCNNCYQRNSTSLNSFFLKSKLLVSFLRSNDVLSFPLRVCFSSYSTFVPFTSVSFSSRYVRKHTHGSRMYHNIYGSWHLAVHFSHNANTTIDCLIMKYKYRTNKMRRVLISLNALYSPKRLMLYRRNGVVVRASASHLVDLGFIP